MKIFFSIIITLSLVTALASATSAFAAPYSNTFLNNNESTTFLEKLGATAANAANYSPKNVWMRALNTLLGLLGVFAVSVIIYGGFQFMSAGGDPDKAKKARKLLQYAIIGFIVIFAAWGIANVVMGTIIKEFLAL